MTVPVKVECCRVLNIIYVNESWTRLSIKHLSHSQVKRTDLLDFYF